MPRLLALALALALTAAADAPSPPVREGSVVRFGLVRVDPAARTIRLPAKLQMSEGVLEYVLVAEYGKTHESLLVTDTKAHDLQAALLLLGARPTGTNTARTLSAEARKPSEVTLLAEWSQDGKAVKRPLHELIALAEASPTRTVTSKLAAGPWLFTGSFLSPEGFSAHFEGSYITLIQDPSAIIGNPRPDAENDDIHVASSSVLPTKGTPITLEIAVPRPTREP